MTKAKTKNSRLRDFRERNQKSGGYLLKNKVKGYGVSICRALLLFGMCFLILQPIFNKISVSFMTEEDLYIIKTFNGADNAKKEAIKPLVEFCM